MLASNRSASRVRQARRVVSGVSRHRRKAWWQASSRRRQSAASCSGEEAMVWPRGRIGADKHRIFGKTRRERPEAAGPDRAWLKGFSRPCGALRAPVVARRRCWSITRSVLIPPLRSAAISFLPGHAKAAIRMAPGRPGVAGAGRRRTGTARQGTSCGRGPRRCGRRRPAREGLRPAGPAGPGWPGREPGT